MLCNFSVTITNNNMRNQTLRKCFITYIQAARVIDK